MLKFKKLAAAVLVLTTSVSLLAACSNSGDNTENSANSDSKVSESLSNSSDTYTYNFFFQNITTWNPHEAVMVEYLTDYTELPLWNLVLNDTADGYEWADEMAVGEPEDVTLEYVNDTKWNIPSDATEGYAWRITLNPNAKWEDGTQINADSYIYSMKQILNPEMNNYAASNYYTLLPIFNAENYYKSGQGAVKKIVTDLTTEETAEYGDSPLFISFTQPTSAFSGYSGSDYYPGSESLYVNEAGDDLMEKYGAEDYIPVTSEIIADINYMLMNFWGEDSVQEDSYLKMAFYEQEIPPTSFEDVGFFKTGDYELTIILYNPLTPYFFKYNCDTLALVNETKYEAGKTQTGDMIKTNYGTSLDTYMSFGPYKLVSFQPDKEWHVTRNENWYGWTDGKHEGQFQTTDVVCHVIDDTATREQLFLQGKADSIALNAENLDSYQGSDYLVYSPGNAIWLLNINNDKELLSAREEPGINKTILTYLDFRKGISLSLNRMEFIAQQGYGKPCYGLISDYYIYDVDSAARYRDSTPAIETLKTYYEVDNIDEITGYDLETARKCLVSGYEQALADGTVSETDKFVFDYPTWTNESNYVKEVNFLQNALDTATKGTALEGRITINMIVSEDYYGMLDSGEYDICMSGWNTSASNPYALMEFFVTDHGSPQSYFGFKPETETLDITLNGSIETHTYYDWYDLLCNGKYAIADSDTRNQILASMELALLLKYRDCPYWSTSTASLLSQKIAYPTYDYVLEVGFGGIRRMTYNYTDAEWEAYCAENNYQLNYQ